MTRHSLGTYCLCILGVITLLTAAGSAFEVVVGDATLAATGDTVKIPIILDEAPGGYAGSTIWFNLSDPSAAEIVSVELPDWASPKGNSPVPADAVSITLGDFNRVVNNGDPNTGLGNLTIRGDLKGQTFINASISRFTADGGSTLKPATRNGTITIGTTTPPEAQFSADVTSGKVPLTVQFTDESTNTPTSWSWDFGDGVTSDAQSPSHEYTVAGTYAVKLTATNGDGSDDEVKDSYITVNPLTPPEAQFSADVTSGKVPLTVQFTDESTNTPTSWSWDFGDGVTSDAQSPSHEYILAGTYAVKLTATNGDGSDDEVKDSYITVNPLTPPEAQFSADVTSGKVPLTVQFTDESTNTPTSWSWDFGDGATSDAQSPSHEYTVAGTYAVKLTATNGDGSDDEVKEKYITVKPKTSPTAEFSAVPTSGKVPLTVQFTDESTNTPTSWSWDFGDGATSDAQSPSHEYSIAGTYAVKLTATNGDGSDDEVKEKYITVNPQIPLVARFFVYPRQGTAPLSVIFIDASEGSPESRLWDFGDGSTSTERFAVHTYTAAGKYTVKLTVTNAAGSDTLTREDYITVKAENPPRAQFIGYPRQGTAPLTVLFVDLSRGSVTSRLWDFGDGSTSTERFAVHTYENPGKYTVKLKVTNSGGSDTATRVNYIRVNAVHPPDAQFTASPRAGTAPLTVTFRDLSKGSVDSRTWDFGDGSTSTGQDPVHIYAAPGTYSVSLTVANDAGSDTAVMKNFIQVKEKKQGTPGPGEPGGKDGGEGMKPEPTGTKEKPQIKLS